MANIKRKSDGRRIFTDEFKREQIGYILRGELTVTELSRKLGIARSLLQRWKRLSPMVDGDGDGHGHGDGHGDGVPQLRMRSERASELQTADYIRELQLLVGKQAVELELLRAEIEQLRKTRRPRHPPAL